MVKTVNEFVVLVSQMHEAQKRYFRERGTQALNDARKLEKLVDQEILEREKRQAEKNQPGLF